MQKYLEKENEISFDKLFNQILGYLLFKDFCESMSDEPVPQLKFYEEVRRKTATILSIFHFIQTIHCPTRSYHMHILSSPIATHFIIIIFPLALNTILLLRA